MNEQIVISGCGLVSALGNSCEENWQNLVAGKSAIQPVDKNFFGAFRNSPDSEKILFDMLSTAIEQALAEAKLSSPAAKNLSSGLILGLGKPDLFTLQHSPTDFSLTEFWNQKLLEQIRTQLPNKCLISLTPVSACSTGLTALYLARHWLLDNLVDIVICAAGESPRHPLISESYRQLGLLTTDAVRPFSSGRTGFALGEGAGAIVLEKESTSKKRQAKISGYLEKIALSQARHNPINYGGVWQPLTDLIKSVTTIADKKIIPDYIKAHGTATVLNDILESQAIIQAFGEAAQTINISSLKPAIGHTLSASGLIELIIAIMAKNNNVIPPTLNWLGRDKNCPLNYTPNNPEKRKINYLLAISLGFGGQIAAALVN